VLRPHPETAGAPVAAGTETSIVAQAGGATEETPAPETLSLAATRGWDMLALALTREEQIDLGCPGPAGTPCPPLSAWLDEAAPAQTERALQHSVSMLRDGFQCNPPGLTAEALAADGNIQAGGARAIRTIVDCVQQASDDQVQACETLGHCMPPQDVGTLLPEKKETWVAPMLEWSLAMLAWREDRPAAEDGLRP